MLGGLALTLIGLAAVAAGLVNALAGGGTLITFPTLVALGVPAVAAKLEPPGKHDACFLPRTMCITGPAANRSGPGSTQGNQKRQSRPKLRPWAQKSEVWKAKPGRASGSVPV